MASSLACISAILAIRTNGRRRVGTGSQAYGGGVVDIYSGMKMTHHSANDRMILRPIEVDKYCDL